MTTPDVHPRGLPASPTAHPEPTDSTTRAAQLLRDGDIDAARQMAHRVAGSHAGGERLFNQLVRVNTRDPWANDPDRTTRREATS